jgi:tetratricopeptide (TPR) repeat protein
MKALLCALLLPPAACGALAPQDATASLTDTSARSRAAHDDGRGGLGKIDFPNSGAPAAQADFLRGVLLLHSFEYEDAAEAFRAAQAADPSFALAFWGESLTYCHPIWNEDAPEQARAALARLAPTAAERLARAGSERERGLLAAVEILWGEGARLERNRAYARAMEALRARFPADDEITTLTSVAILGTSGQLRDERVYMRAAALAEQVYQRNPEHPGAIHYAIHAFDDPVHAPLGLRYALRYAEVAPAAQHALHMPSHIFVALGMWQASVDTNVRSVAAADERRARKGLDVDARGFHSLAWLAYSELQLGRAAHARALLADMQRDAAEKFSLRTRTHLGLMHSAFLVDRAGRDDAALADALAIPVDLAGVPLDVVASELYAAGSARLRLGDRAAAEAALAGIDERLASAAAEATALGAALSCCRVGGGGYGAASPEHAAAEVLRRELAGELALAAGDEASGLETLREAARREDAMGFDFGPPVVVKPAHELLGEALLARGDGAGARAEFEAALARAPRRARALLGRARALAAAGDAAGASAAYAELAAQWSAADLGGPELSELRPEQP